MKQRFSQQVSIRVTGYGTFIPLSEATNLNGGIIYAISVGANIAAGAVTGFFTPNIGKTRLETSAKRSFEASPIGAVYGVITTGNEAALNQGDAIVLTIDNPTLKKLP